MSLFGTLSGAVFSRGHYGSDNPPAPPPAPPPGPEIQVVGNGLIIANGDATPSATDHTDFGSVAQNTTPITRVYTVRNVGETDLSLSNLIVPAGFSVTDPLLPSVPPSGEDTFSVHLPVYNVGVFSGLSLSPAMTPVTLTFLLRLQAKLRLPQRPPKFVSLATA